MTDNIGLNSFRKKKTERPENIIPELSEDTNRTMPEDLLKLPQKKLTSKDLPKSIRLPLNTHTAIAQLLHCKVKKFMK